MVKKNVLFTFDYELFLGKRSGTVHNCMVQPTERILTILNRHDVKGIFFVDTVFLIKLKQECSLFSELAEDYELISNQLIRMIDDGHYVLPHIHAHWLDAVYIPDERQWDLSNFRYYRFASLSEEKRTELFDSSVNLIQELIAKSQRVYSIDAYRAGGWSIQPFEIFRPYFKTHQIKFDFSVIAGKKILSDAHQYDYSKAPKKAIYKFGEKVEVEDINGEFVEFTISSVFVSRFTQWIYFKINGFKKRLALNESYGKGNVIECHTYENIDVYAEKGKRWLASMEGLNFVSFTQFLINIMRSSYFQFISHPKLITPVELGWLNLLLFFLKPFRINTDYKKMGY